MAASELCSETELKFFRNGKLHAVFYLRNSTSSSQEIRLLLIDSFTTYNDLFSCGFSCLANNCI